MKHVRITPNGGAHWYVFGLCLWTSTIGKLVLFSASWGIDYKESQPSALGSRPLWVDPLPPQSTTERNHCNKEALQQDELQLPRPVLLTAFLSFAVRCAMDGDFFSTLLVTRYPAGPIAHSFSPFRPHDGLPPPNAVSGSSRCVRELERVVGGGSAFLGYMTLTGSLSRTTTLPVVAWPALKLATSTRRAADA